MGPARSRQIYGTHAEGQSQRAPQQHTRAIPRHPWRERSSDPDRVRRTDLRAGGQQPGPRAEDLHRTGGWHRALRCRQHGAGAELHRRLACAAVRTDGGGMTLIRSGRGPNPLKGFTVDPAAIRTVGRDLQRPECILAERDGTLWSADARGGVMRIGPDGRQTLVAQTPDPHFDLSASAANSLLSGTLPNGLAFASNGDILISNFGTDRLERMTRTGETSVLLNSLGGAPLGKVNFVLRDSKDRIWITVSTMINPWSDAIRTDLTDGSLILIDEDGPRVVADGFH